MQNDPMRARRLMIATRHSVSNPSHNPEPSPIRPGPCLRAVLLSFMKLPRRLALLAAALATTSALFGADPAFDTWADQAAATWVRSDPNEATEDQYFSGEEQDSLDRQLTPGTTAYLVSRRQGAEAILAQLAAFDRAKLSPEQRITASVIDWSLRTKLASRPFDDHWFVFNQFIGLHLDLVNFLSQSHPIRNRRDIENYLARLELVATCMDEGIERARGAATRGFLMPDFITRSALGQFEHFLADAPAKNVFVTSLAERAALLPSVTPEERAAFVASAERITADQIIPAYRRAQGLLQEQLPLTTADAGLWRLPDGAAAYANALRRHTSTTLSPDEIHTLGLQETARIEAEMDALLRQLGHADGTINARMAELNASLQPPADPDPRPALLQRYEAVLADALKRTDALFDLRPKAPCVVKREPSFTEKTTSAHYVSPARDGSRPGIFWAPLPGPTFSLTTLRTLVYHEAVPGHHFQIALQQENQNLPRCLSDTVFGSSTAYTEGWALYAEQLAAEDGWYEGDPVGRLGQLSLELMRARRLVIDTGLHVKHWTRQQAIDYGFSASEVERYVVWPGQACAYKVGQLKILALRAKARAALGDKFSIKEFHNTVLKNGNLPLDVLEQVVDAWIATRQAS
jgi:uncharacterized protein (DUF885 family)